MQVYAPPFAECPPGVCRYRRRGLPLGTAVRGVCGGLCGVGTLGFLNHGSPRRRRHAGRFGRPTSRSTSRPTTVLCGVHQGEMGNWPRFWLCGGFPKPPPVFRRTSESGSARHQATEISCYGTARAAGRMGRGTSAQKLGQRRREALRAK